MKQVVAAIVAGILVLVVAAPVAAQGPQGGDVPGLSNASDAPDGTYVPSGMDPDFRSLIAGYAGFLDKVSGNELGFQAALREIIANSGQHVPAPVTTWGEASDRLFGVFDMAYQAYKQWIAPAAQDPTPASGLSTSGASGMGASPGGSSVPSAAPDGSVADKGALTLGLGGLAGFLAAGGAFIRRRIGGG